MHAKPKKPPELDDLNFIELNIPEISVKTVSLYRLVGDKIKKKED